MVASTTPDQLRRCLDAVDFPANKEDLLDAADRSGFDAETIRALRAIPPETYANLSQVIASVTLGDGGVGDAEKAAARRSHTKPGLAENAKDVGPPSPIVEELGENRAS